MSFRCPECFSISSNAVKCLTCGFPISKSKPSSVELRNSELNPLMITYQSPIARENPFLPQPKPKPIVIKSIEESSDQSEDGLNCLQCGGSITPDDIKCSHCTTLIMRRYCSHCSKLIPDHATICPLCNKDIKEHFLYSKLRRTKILIGVGTAAIFAFVVIILILQQPDSKTAQVQAAAITKPEVQLPPPVAKSPAPEISKQETKLPEPPVVYEIVPPPATTKSFEPPKEVEKPQLLKSKVSVTKAEEPQPVTKAEKPKQIAKIVEPKQFAKAEQPEVRPMLSPALQRTVDLRSQQRVLKARSLNHKGYSLIRAGRPYDAIPVLELAVRSFPERQRDLNYAYALFNLAVAYRMAGKPEMAIPLLQERIKINNQRDVVARELLSAKREAGLSGTSEND